MTKFPWVWVRLINIFQECSVGWHMLTFASAAHGHVAFWMFFILQIHFLAKYCTDSMYLICLARTSTKVCGKIFSVHSKLCNLGKIYTRQQNWVKETKSGKLLLCNQDIGHAILISSIYFLLLFINLGCAALKLSRLGWWYPLGSTNVPIWIQPARTWKMLYICFVILQIC